jgi:hypothetical protein
LKSAIDTDDYGGAQLTSIDCFATIVFRLESRQRILVGYDFPAMQPCTNLVGQTSHASPLCDPFGQPSRS